MKLRLQTVAVVLIAFASAILACGRVSTSSPAQTPSSIGPTLLPPGNATRFLLVGNRERSYVIHIPPTYEPNQPTPVVLIFHGGGTNAENIMRVSGFDAQADAARFIAVYPNGTGRAGNQKVLTWNGGLCCGYAQEQNVDDVGFVRLLLKDLPTVVNVDPKRVYATGLSNGAIMSYRLACELSDQIAAIAPVAATQNIEVCQPSQPVSVIHFHGTADPYAPYDGGVGSGWTKVDFAAVQDSIQFWVEHNACPTEPETEHVGSIVHARYAPCDQDTAVELYTVEGGGHAWPGGQKYAEGAVEPTHEISATALIRDFFAAHPKP